MPKLDKHVDQSMPQALYDRLKRIADVDQEPVSVVNRRFLREGCDRWERAAAFEGGNVGNVSISTVGGPA